MLGQDFCLNLYRSGTHGLNEELGRHRGREGRSQCMLCDDECESVIHVLWDVQPIILLERVLWKSFHIYWDLSFHDFSL